MVISNGLPEGTTIEVRPTFDNFTNVVVQDGSKPGEKIVSFTAQTNLIMQGTGALPTFARSISTSTDFVVRIPDFPPDPIHQEIPTEILSMNLTGGGLFGDPDFDLLQLRAGNDFGLPSPGHTTLTRLYGGNWRVDSFFDITYQIEFSGAPGSALEGFGGTTQGGPVRVNQGGADVDLWVDLHKPPLFDVSMDLSFVITGDPSPCDCMPGDANNDGTFNLVDILYVIAYKYGSPAGPPPVPYRICSGDVNCDCQVDLIDILYMIANLYNSPPGPAPCSCDRWLGSCGGPLRK